jgi:predicted dehydrogenase
MGYSTFSREFPERLKIVGVAEPKDFNRKWMVDNHQLPAENVFSDWHALVQKPRLADSVIIATQDAMHAEPAVAFAKQGYAILLEKPMAPNEADCIRITQAARAQVLAVCHVMRYTAYTSTGN